MYVQEALGARRELHIHPLVLGLEEVLSYCVDAGNRAQALCRSSQYS
jgi:hypothetical protein